MMFLIGVMASASTWGPYDGGFISPARDDAPVDGVVLYAANFTPEVVATDSNGGVVTLEAELVTGVGAPPVAAIHPPVGGWAPGVTYDLLVSPYASYPEPGAVGTALTITAGADPAAPAEPPEVGDVVLGEWSEETMYGWGCCEPTRTVEVHRVTVPNADEWAWVELVGTFDLAGPSQITSEPIHTHLDVARGPGYHTLSFLQWFDERGPQPPCFDVVAMSAAGVAGESQTLCAVDDPPPGEPGADEGDGDGARGCATGAHGGVPWLVALLPLLRRRQPRS